MENKNNGLGQILSCFVWIIVSLTLGAWSVMYSINVIFHQQIAYGWAFLISLFTGWFTIILAFILWILQLAGVHI